MTAGTGFSAAGALEVCVVVAVPVGLDVLAVPVPGAVFDAAEVVGVVAVVVVVVVVVVVGTGSRTRAGCWSFAGG